LPRRRHNHRHGKGGTYGIGFAIALPAHWQALSAAGRWRVERLVRPPIGAAAAGKVPALARGLP
jgi:feruloyl esterase